MSSTKLLSIVIPCYNEEANIAPFYQQLIAVLEALSTALDYEIVYVNDGSQDKTASEITAICHKDTRVHLISLSRNFGKEAALSAGMRYAHGAAILGIDGDGQHPVELIPEFIKAWQAGNHVVVGIRTGNQGEGFVKRYGSKLFYKMTKSMSDGHLVKDSTDFCLITREVQSEFIKLTEHGRITRGLIDWLGFKKTYISFVANQRLSGDASYSFRRLFRLAVDSFVASSLLPLYLSLYIGFLLLPLSTLLGVFSSIEMIIGDPLGLRIHGTAFIAILILFAVGLLLVSQGFTALYLSKVHTETQNRPLYIIDKHQSHNLEG